MLFKTSLQNNFSNERLSFQKKQKPRFGETFPPFATQSTLSLLNGGVSKQLWQHYEKLPTLCGLEKTPLVIQITLGYYDRFS